MSPLFIAAILAFDVALCEWLARRTVCRHLGAALLVILLAAIQANLGLIPTASNAPPLYGAVFKYLAPLSIFLLLLEVNLRELRQAGLPMLVMFLIGSAGTVAGVFTGLWLADAREVIGPAYAALGGMFTGTYTGGSVNFNAVALHYRVVEDGTLYAGALAADNIMTSVWMIATIALPRLLWSLAPTRRSRPDVIAGRTDAETLRHEHDTETLHPGVAGLVLGLGAATLWLADQISGALVRFGMNVPSILIVTTLALLLAQYRPLSRLPGTRMIGMLLVYLFLAVIGAHAELDAISNLGSLGLSIFLFVSVLIVIHGLVVFSAGRVLRQDWDVVAVASQANIGGSTSALALAKSLGRTDLLLPAILVGSLGNGVGTYLGFVVAGLLGVDRPG